MEPVPARILWRRSMVDRTGMVQCVVSARCIFVIAFSPYRLYS